MKKILVFSFVAIFLILSMSFANAGLLDWIFGSSEDDVSIENSTLYERTATTETFKNPDGTMTITLYSGIRFIEEDDTWKKIEDARSLKNSGINCVVKKDSKDDPDVECLDFNYTSIKVDVKDKKSYPIKIYSKNKTTEKDSTSETKDTDSKDSTNLILSKLIESKKLDIETINIKFGDELHIGENSTTIILEDNNVEALENLGYYSSTENYETGSQMKWKITAIPSGSTIINATQHLFIYNTYGSLNNNARVWRINNQSWTDASLDGNGWSSLSLTNQSDLALSSISDDTWTFFDVTDIINHDYTQGNSNTSWRLEDTDQLIGSDPTNFIRDDLLSYGNAFGANSGIEIEGKAGTHSTGNIPYLNITYVPGINIISPTPSQIFTQDTPITIFNISTGEVRDTCLWSENGNNYTLNANASNTGFDLTNTTMVDGPHTITFWCNDNSDVWYESDSVSFDVDSVNVTVCRDLTVAREYELLNDISESSNNCITIQNSNISIDINGNKISVNGSSSCFYIDDGGAVSYNNSIIKDGLLNCSDYIISNDGASYNTIILNVTYLNGVEWSDGSLYRKWYFQPTINDSSGNLASATVNIYDSTGSLVASELTDSNGQITQQNLTEYINNGETKTYYTPHTMNVSKANYITNSTTYNLTELNNTFPNIIMQSESSDTCTYTGSGNWNIDCSDNCKIDSLVDIDGDLYLQGSGTVILSSTLNFNSTGQNIVQGSGCKFAISSGGKIS